MWGMRCDGCMFVIGKLRDSIAMKEKVQEDESNSNKNQRDLGPGLRLKGKTEREACILAKGSRSSNCVFFFFLCFLFLSFRLLLHDDERWKEGKYENLVYGVCVCICMCMCMYVRVPFRN